MKLAMNVVYIKRNSLAFFFWSVLARLGVPAHLIMFKAISLSSFSLIIQRDHLFSP